jgi:hypothetical protein
MDQTPIPFTYHAQKTLEVVGRRTVHVRKSTCETKRGTFAMTITASGKVLNPMLILKGKPGGKIEKREFPTFPSEVLYACQDNAWMDEGVMLMWVQKVLKPYVREAPEHIVPILFLDSYRCHMMASVVREIQKLGVEVEHIPGGCTTLEPQGIQQGPIFRTGRLLPWRHFLRKSSKMHGDMASTLGFRMR